jgi:hypothetical protein
MGRTYREEGIKPIAWRHQEYGDMQRLSVNRALEIIGAEWPRIRVSENDPIQPFLRGELHHRRRSFWGANEYRLDELAYEVKRAYRKRARQVRPDLVENHEAGTILTAAYEFLKRCLSRRGVDL